MKLHRSFLVLLGASAFLLFGGAGCVPGLGSSGSKVPDGGVFRSSDQGNTWGQKTQILAVGGTPRNFSLANIITLVADPSDPQALYAGTDGAGLLVSYNLGEGWFQPDQLRTGYIQSISVDPHNKCVIYITLGTQLFKSTDCSRSWKNVYEEARANTVLTSVAVDPNNSNIVWVGTSAGDLLKSADGAKSWVVKNRFKNGVLKILLSPQDGNHIFVATPDQGVYRSLDGGEFWGDDMNEGLKQYGGAFAVKDIIFLDVSKEWLLLSTQYGLIKSFNLGANWDALKLLTPPGGAQIQAVAVNPKNYLQIFYSTNSTLYRTDDGGEKWITKKLPTTRVPSALMVNQTNPNVMFMGSRFVEKQSGF
ncbi:MAG: hypothetical protein HY981_02015 [Candidatus Magasanikbacteria bacterium]|nr:hypothetical protein [Candidatus Magasanikbacteria bacterium]